MDRNVLLAVAAAQEAWDDAGLDGVDPTRVGILVGSAIGGIATIAEQQQVFAERGFDRVSPFFIPSRARRHGERPDRDPARASRARTSRPSRRARPARRRSARPPRRSAAARPTSCSRAAPRRRSSR